MGIINKMSESSSDVQIKLKYCDHDFAIEDLKSLEIDKIRSQAIRGFVETQDSDNVSLIIKSFMGYLTSKGFRITKKEKV